MFYNWLKWQLEAAGMDWIKYYIDQRVKGLPHKVIIIGNAGDGSSLYREAMEQAQKELAVCMGVPDQLIKPFDSWEIKPLGRCIWDDFTHFSTSKKEKNWKGPRYFGKGPKNKR